MTTPIGIEARPPLGSGLALGLQHILVMLSGMIAVPLALGAALDLSSAQQVVLVQGAIVTSGLGTIVQALGVGVVGARLPIVMGAAFVFISPMISIGRELDLRAIMGAIIVGGVAELALAPFVWRIRRFFPPIVTGTVISIIGLGLLPLGFGWAVGVGTDLYGTPAAFGLSGLVLGALVVCNRFSSGTVRSASVLIAIVLGYAVAAVLGVLDLSSVREATWAALPTPFAFGTPVFNWGAVAAILIAQFASLLETIGDTVTITSMDNRELRRRELRGAVIVDGLGSALAPIANGLSLTSFSQNIGVIGLTRVGSRYVVALGGLMLVLLGLLPKLGALITSMPLPVLGGAAIAMFGSVAAAGVNQLREVELNERNLLVFSIAVGLGVGVATAPPDVFAVLPTSIRVLLESSVAVGGITAIVLDLILPASPGTSTTAHG